tara:strand:- start:5378 stop:5875 length:498 start_codon:yes stop_codon:yes gene_type:complete
MRVPKKPNGRRALPFYWWRRFRTHKSLPYKFSLLDKIKNGDFEYPEYFQQAEWELIWMKDEQKEFIDNYQGREPEQDRLYLEIELRARKRYNKLFEDGMKTEYERMDDLKSKLSKEFKLSKQDIQNIMEQFGGTTEKLYFHIAKLQGKNIESIKTFNKWGISSAG